MLELRGRTVCVDGRPVILGPNALALFRTLSGSTRVMSRQQLAAGVAMSRLRRALDVPGLVSTVVHRGYRCDAEPLTD